MKILGLLVVACLTCAGCSYLILRPAGHKEADANSLRHRIKVVRKHARDTTTGFKSYLTRVFGTHKTVENIDLKVSA